MNSKKLQTLCLMLVLALGATAQDYYDITQYYLKNSLFDEQFDYKATESGNVAEEQLPVEGWTAAHTAGYTITGIYQIGTKKTFNGASVPAINVDGTTAGGVLALSTGWGQSLIFQQSVTLPSGKYKIVSAYYNGDASKTAGSSLLGWVPTSGATTMSKVSSFGVGKWVTDTLSFTITSSKAGKIQVGFKATSGGSANSAKISVDYVKLLRDTPYGERDIAAYKVKLVSLLSTAKSQYGTGEKRGAADLKAAIDAAQTVYDNSNATVVEIDEAYENLTQAVETFKALQTADATLKSLLKTANTTAEGATGEGIDELRQAITDAQAVYDNAKATVDELNEAAEKLRAAIDKYNFGNPSGNIPTVTTDTRFVRGATMAFGRIKSVNNNGATIKTRGFCCAENPEPTINDIVSQKTLSNNGTIYWLQDLKPATKYYMRAYVITTGYQVAYGEAIKFYTVPKGTVTCAYNNNGDAATNDRIKKALDDACYYFNNMCYTTRKFHVDYSAGTPTADCNYTDEPHMNIGPNTSYQRTGTVMHEMQHGLGLQNYSTQWCKANLRSGSGTGYWLGDRVAEALHFWDNNTTTRLNGDKIHMWPYGVNGANEDNGSDMLYLANAMLCQALGEDGLEHNYWRHADPYYSLEQEDDVKVYLTNESADRGLFTSYLIPDKNGNLKWRQMSAADLAANDSAAWYTTFTPSNQYYQFRNAATGQYLSYGSGIKTAQKAALTASENWHLMKGRVDVDGLRGYWIIHPESNWTPHCLQANANGATVSATFNIANAAETQRWIILTAGEVEQAEAKAVSKLKTQATDMLSMIKSLAAVPHTEETAGTDQTLSTTIAALEARLTAAADISELSAILGDAQDAAMLFLQNVTATNPQQPFDLTFKMTNVSLADGTNGWNGGGTVNYDCVEFYEKTFDFNQTVSGLPAGKYRFCAQGFQRPGTSIGAYNDYKAGTNNPTALIYAGSSTAKLHHICDTILSRKIGKGNEATVTSSKYVPNDMESASAYFEKGLYENSVNGEVASNNGSLKVGIKSTSMPSSYWAIFNSFRLYFYGKMGEELLGIDSLQGQTAQHRQGIYSIDGRRLSSDATLRPGLYIVNGRKVVVR